MTTDEMIYVMEAHKQGWDIEFRPKNEEETTRWCSSQLPGWNWSVFDYRVKEVKPSINWDHVSDNYNYLATDACGDSYLFEEEPQWDYEMWCGEGAYCPVDSHSSFNPGKCPPEKSLISRPR